MMTGIEAGSMEWYEFRRESKTEVILTPIDDKTKNQQKHLSPTQPCLHQLGKGIDSDNLSDS